MDYSFIESQLKELWKSTFHDSEEYINLVFENYFDINLVEFQERDNNIVSALMGIPYDFTDGSNNLKGLYLCGLATSKEYRKKGLMGNLLHSFGKRLGKDYDFLFLIPSNYSIIPYYEFHGFHPGIFRSIERYSPAHNFRNDYETLLDSTDDRIKAMKSSLFDNLDVNEIVVFTDDKIEEIFKYIDSKERIKKNFLVLNHSKKDIIAVLHECIISGGELYICRNNDIISGVAFLNKRMGQPLEIPHIYADTLTDYYKILDAIKVKYDNESLKVYRFPSEIKRTALWEPFYGSKNPDGGDLDTEFGIMTRPFDFLRNAETYGLIKITNLKNILEYISQTHPEINFKVIVKDYPDSHGGWYYNKTKKSLETQYLDEYKNFLQENPSISILTKKQITEILFRKNISSSLITDIFGISPVQVNMCLLLD